MIGKRFLGRRTLIRLLAAGGVLCAGLTPAEAEDQLVIANWGGVFGESLEKNVLQSFSAQHDIDIVIHRQGSAADTLTKVRAEKGNPSIDVIFTTWAGAAALANEGLAEELTIEEVPELESIFDKLVGRTNGHTYWIGVNPKSRGLAVRRDLVEMPDELTMNWLANDSLKRRIAVPQFGWGNGAILLALAMANGGSETNVEPGFDFAKTAAPNFNIIYRTTGEAVRLLSTGEAAVAFVNSNAAAGLVSKGLDVEFQPPRDTPLFLDADAIMLVKGGPGGKSAALSFLRHFLQPAQIDAYSFGTGSSSPRADAPTPPKDMVPFPFDPTQLTGAFFPSGEIAETITQNFDAWNERWNREVIPLFGQ